MSRLTQKLGVLLKLRNITSAQLGRAANLSRPTMSRIMRGHVTSDESLNRIAAVLEVSPGYLRGGYQLPTHLTEGDVLALADLRNMPLLQLVREAAERGVAVVEIKKLMEIMKQYK